MDSNTLIIILIVVLSVTVISNSIRITTLERRLSRTIKLPCSTVDDFKNFLEELNDDEELEKKDDNNEE